MYCACGRAVSEMKGRPYVVEWNHPEWTQVNDVNGGMTRVLIIVGLVKPRVVSI